MTAYLTDMYILPKPTCAADKELMWLGDFFGMLAVQRYKDLEVKLHPVIRSCEAMVCQVARSHLDLSSTLRALN